MISDWSLLIHIFTIPDRVSHGFWKVHEPGLHDGAGGENGEPGQFVRDVYRLVDQRMGLLLDEIGDDATVVLLSDHGFQADPSTGYGGHRIEGIFVASGPGIRPAEERLTLSVLDVTPTLLALLGLPVAADMDGKVAQRALTVGRPPRSIPSYERQRDSAEPPETTIDETTEEQLRSLGYVD
jgi:predicted AlkP superfamily phosphohydrolase/phosphomutase